VLLIVVGEIKREDFRGGWGRGGGWGEVLRKGGRKGGLGGCGGYRG